MRQESLFSLIVILIGLALQGIAWIWVDAPQDIRVLLTILSLLPVLLAILVQGVESQGIKAWWASFIAFLGNNSLLMVMTILSIGVLIVLPIVGISSYLAEIAITFATVLLAISLFTLVKGLGTQPSLRIIKGSSDDVYLVKDGVRQLIPDALTQFFVTLDTYRDVECISDRELQLYREGIKLPSISTCDLVKGSGPAVYMIWEGQRKYIPDGPTLENFFQDKKPREITDRELEKIPRTGALRSVVSVRPKTMITNNYIVSGSSVESINQGNNKDG